MGEESVMPPSPHQHESEATGEPDCRSEATGEPDCRSVVEIDGQNLEAQMIQGTISPPAHDQEPDHNVLKETEEDRSSNIQTFTGDDIIPSPVLKGIATISFFGHDLTSALQIVGTKYNSLMKRYKEETCELETLRATSETLRNKCIQECEPRYEILKRKYTQECSERKRLYNELIELKGNIRVFCRCRPLNAEEISKGYTSVLDFDQPQDTAELQIICSDSSRKNFKFDHVFGPKDNQEGVFAEILPIVNSVLDGYNVCIFAYGQTGTGKTFTMEGTPENRGVNYRALDELFRSSNERSTLMRYEFSVSILEVYNEKIRDLLVDNWDQAARKLEIKQAADGSQDVPGLVEAQAYSVDEMWEMLRTGGRNRSVGSTNANELSSRSHCLVRVTIKGENLVNGQMSKSHLWLVDLAGSERVGKIEVEGERLKESQFINKSLSALGDVISALATKNPHIPYRNSKLTHLLQSSLGGDCKTLMFAQISPSSADLGETLCSLNFASRVRGIEHGPVRKQSDQVESLKLKQLAEKLRQEEKESARLNDSLQLMHLKYASRENVFKSLHEKIRDAEQASRNYQSKVKDLETQLADQKKASRLQETRDLTKYSSKPPLAPIKMRQPLGRITNRMPPSGPRRSSITMMPSLHNKENSLAMDKADTGPTMFRARRISLTPVVRNIPIQPKRRASIAIRPNKTERLAPLSETKPWYHTRDSSQVSQMRDARSPKYTQEEGPTMSRARRISLSPVVRNIPIQPKRRASIAIRPNKTERLAPLSEANPLYHTGDTTQVPQMRGPRRSVATFMPLVAGTPLSAAVTPDGGRKFSSILASSKYCSPPLMQAMWKSKIPSFGSPRQRLRLVSSPGSSSGMNSAQSQNKLCFSVQKRLMVSPQAQPKHVMFPGLANFSQALRDKEIVGGFGTAQRVLCKNRRRSVI